MSLGQTNSPVDLDRDLKGKKQIGGIPRADEHIADRLQVVYFFQHFGLHQTTLPFPGNILSSPRQKPILVQPLALIYEELTLSLHSFT
jgi:hypothetical protein